MMRSSNSTATDKWALWRGDPDTTFSDWKIVVTSSDGPATTYHLHKMMLGCGPRKSKYFCHMIRSSFEEGATCTSCIELEPPAAQVFPVLLDCYLYNQPL
ncbi:unknown protein [Seminavis robusta]|uniref:BTB domain-containing protein n=1 Tax=Seminavis robusta TaxID=568900 RepID=A0A9N8EY87_9STRA|nr:unknown protein [Seminavis robusta]|eukprot:Sro2096_g314260.1 n/a (100) ;mRNA; f:2293-2592